MHSKTKERLATLPDAERILHQIYLSAAHTRTLERCRVRLGGGTLVATIRRAIVVLDDLLDVMHEDGSVRIQRADGTVEVWRIR